MAQRERLGHLKFMQRAKFREEQKKKEVVDEVAANENEWTVTPANLKTPGTKCVVIVEGDPSPSAASGRMYFQSSTSSAPTTDNVASQLTVVGDSESSRTPTVQR